MQKHIRTEGVWRELTEHSQIYHKILNNRKEETDMSDFLTEKNKKTGILGKLKWVLCGFFILFSLGAIGASEKYIGEGRWGMAATEIILGLLFLYPTFREIQKALKKKKAGEIACWFESYAQNTVSFEKLEQELGKGAVKKLEKIYCGGIYPEYPDRQRRKLYYDHCTEQTRK